jgi:hypothetical protein
MEDDWVEEKMCTEIVSKMEEITDDLIEKGVFLVFRCLPSWEEILDRVSVRISHNLLAGELLVEDILVDNVVIGRAVLLKTDRGFRVQGQISTSFENIWGRVIGDVDR